jgi:hypothetical protein
MANEAFRLNQRLVRGRKVRLSFEGTRRKDRYGRLLALVYPQSVNPRQPRRCVNVELVLQGVAWTYFHDSTEAARDALRPLIAAQKEALKHRRGVWREWLAGQGSGETWVSTAVRIHRLGCSKIGKQPTKKVVSLVEELGEGRSPCRECQPLKKP